MRQIWDTFFCEFIMPKKSNQYKINLRLTAIDIINKIQAEKNLNFKTACLHFYEKAKFKKAQTGFDLSDFHKFYQNIRKFKNRYYVT